MEIESNQRKRALIPNENIEIVLASSSPRRVHLLENLGLKFKTMPSDVAEIVEPGTAPAAAVIQLSRQKAEAVLERLERERNGQRLKGGEKKLLMIVGADTTVVLDKKLLGKPESIEMARAMLKNLSGRCHEVFTGITILLKDRESGETSEYSSFEMSHVYFRDLTAQEIDAYVATGEPMDKAGGYALQGIGAAFIQKIEGCFTNVIGLPVPLVVSTLRRAGITVLGSPS